MLAKILFRHHSISSSNRYNVFQLSTVLQDLHLLVEPILVQNQITCTHSLAFKSEGWSNKAIINLNSLAERRKHFSENQFFVPNRIIWVLFYGGFTLQTNKMFTRQIIITIIPSLIKAIRAWKNAIRTDAMLHRCLCGFRLDFNTLNLPIIQQMKHARMGWQDLLLRQ